MATGMAIYGHNSQNALDMSHVRVRQRRISSRNASGEGYTRQQSRSINALNESPTRESLIEILVQSRTGGGIAPPVARYRQPALGSLLG